MTFRRSVIALCLTAVIVLAVAAMSMPRHRTADRDAAAAALAASVPAAAAGSSAAVASPGDTDGTQRLEAVRTVKLFCDLVDSGRLWHAAALFATPRIWTRRELRALRQFDFHSASARFAPDAASLLVVARVRVTAVAGSPVRDGDATLFFTLGRVGTTAGGWLITAVTTSP